MTEGRCGWGGRTPCERPPRDGRKRGLCEQHRDAIIKAAARCGALERGHPARKPPAIPRMLKPLPPPAPINPPDIFDAGDRERVPPVERAEHVARWLHRYGRAVRRADALRVAGVPATGSQGKNVIDAAVERGWVRRGERAVLAPGEVSPPSP